MDDVGKIYKKVKNCTIKCHLVSLFYCSVSWELLALCQVVLSHPWSGRSEGNVWGLRDRSDYVAGGIQKREEGKEDHTHAFRRCIEWKTQCAGVQRRHACIRRTPGPMTWQSCPNCPSTASVCVSARLE